jgi:ATP-dependent helicase HepA
VSFSAAWFRILDEGFGIFDNSVASLQQAVDDATDSAWELIFDRGLDATTDAIQVVRELLAAEVERVREQDALDSIESTIDERSVFSRMISVETEVPDFASLTDALLSAGRAPGNLRFEPIGNPVLGVGSYEVFGRLPGTQVQIPLVPAWRLKRDFLPLKGQVGTFQRRIAIERGDVRLYRYGDQFIDAVSDFLWHDDRGRAFGMWRWLPDWPREERPVYRFDYAIEANPLEAIDWIDHRGVLAALPLAPGLDRLSVNRRADGIFAPIIVSLWIDENGSLLEDDRHLEAVRAPYAKPSAGVQGGDYSLNRTRIEHAYELVPATFWGGRWRAAEKAAQEHIRSDATVRAAIDHALAVAQREAAIGLNQLQLRSARTDGEERARLEQEIEFESIVASALDSSIRTPTLRLDSTGVVVVSGHGLDSIGTA